MLNNILVKMTTITRLQLDLSLSAKCISAGDSSMSIDFMNLMSEQTMRTFN